MKESDKKGTSINNYGKFGLIERITQGASLQNKTTLIGVGDDSSVLDYGDNLTLVSTDLLLEGIHFNLVYTPLRHLGYKSVIRGISDICAMNGTPCQILIGLGISTRFSAEQVDEFYDGIYTACKKYHVDLAGGDITSSLTGLTISVTATGYVGKKSLIRRQGADPNDLICVTGNFGASFMGLRILERERRLFEKDKTIKPDFGGYEYLIERQLKPEFPVNVINGLKEASVVPTAMIDVSDGLASDLIHICKKSGTGCRIFYEKMPVDLETSKAAEDFGTDPVTAALNGGEDYELLFTIHLEDSEKIKNVSGVTVIGHLTPAGQGYFLINENGARIELRAQGWGKSLKNQSARTSDNTSLGPPDKVDNIISVG
jgi:thiamine-monophosphate kinase